MRDTVSPVRQTPAEQRLAAGRAEIELMLNPGPKAFPRSRAMRFLTGGRGRMVALGLVGGLLVVKPRLAVSLMGLLPLGKLLPVARLLQSLR